MKITVQYLQSGTLSAHLVSETKEDERALHRTEDLKTAVQFLRKDNLRAFSVGQLMQMKKELKDFNALTGRWK